MYNNGLSVTDGGKHTQSVDFSFKSKDTVSITVNPSSKTITFSSTRSANVYTQPIRERYFQAKQLYFVVGLWSELFNGSEVKVIDIE